MRYGGGQVVVSPTAVFWDVTQRSPKDPGILERSFVKFARRLPKISLLVAT